MDSPCASIRTSQGGQQWWEQVLRNIHEAHAFVFAADETALASRACLAEAEYARQLGKPMVRVDLKQSLGFPGAASMLAGVRSVLYDSTSKYSMQELAVTIRQMTKTPLSEVLPPVPPVPATYIYDVTAQVRYRGDLLPADQLAVVDQLRLYANEGVPRTDITRLLIEFSLRDDITVPVAASIQTLGEQLGVDPAKLGVNDRSASDPRGRLKGDPQDDDLDTHPPTTPWVSPARQRPTPPRRTRRVATGAEAPSHRRSSMSLRPVVTASASISRSGRGPGSGPRLPPSAS